MNIPTNLKVIQSGNMPNSTTLTSGQIAFGKIGGGGNIRLFMNDGSAITELSDIFVPYGNKLSSSSPLPIGPNSTVNGFGGIAIGYNSSAAGGLLSTGPIAIGFNAVSSINSIAIGYFANAAANTSVVIGFNASQDATSQPGNSVIIGSGAHGYATLYNSGNSSFSGQGVIIGSNASGTWKNVTVIGYGAKADPTANTSLPIINANGADYALSIGAWTNALASGAIAVGGTANADGSICIGSACDEVNGIAIGNSSRVMSGANSGISIGYYSNAISPNTVAIGSFAIAGLNASYGIAIGRGALLQNSNSGIAIGLNSGAVNSSALVLGTQSSANGLQALAIGTGTQAIGLNTIAIGTSVVANNTGCIAIGAGAVVSSANTMQLGSSALVTVYRGAGTATAFNTTSDERIKENIVEANTTICLSDANRLKVKRFSYKDFVNSTGDKTVTGFIAQDFREVFPKQVSEVKKVYQVEGKEDVVFEDLLSIDTSQVIYTLVGAIQELTKRIEQLENKS